MVMTLKVSYKRLNQTLSMEMTIFFLHQQLMHKRITQQLNKAPGN